MRRRVDSTIREPTRARLTAMVDALDGLATQARAALLTGPADRESEVAPYLDAVERDAAVARGAVSLVLRREAIASLLVDNLNASVHLRALLTDLFLIEQFLKPSLPDPR